MTALPKHTPEIVHEHDPNAALLAAYVAGDVHAAAALTRAVTPMIYALAMRMLGEQAAAEDVTQDAMLRLWRHAPKWEYGRAKISTWLYRVASNLCTDRLRARRDFVQPDAVAEVMSDDPSAADALQAQARASALRDGIAQLPERQAKAVALRHLSNLTNPEIAEIMECKVEAVESLLARGKRQLAAVLAPQKDALGFNDD
ncbi:sigma-70 family RNA polymerase sigma factor [Nereida sp.]|uniref:sigma-70 family RNA polymerase sigma factor n=1 Tax=Nereida sp. TaxID=2736090 RepID=UPI003F697FA4